MRSAADVVVLVVGFVVGGFLAMLLPFLFWPGGVTAFGFLIGPAPSVEAIRTAELTYGAVLGALGAAVPPMAFRLGYAVAALLVVFMAAGSYWGRHDPVMPLLMAIGVWLLVAGLIEIVRRLVTGDPRRER